MHISQNFLNGLTLDTGDGHYHSPPPAPVKPRVAFQTPSTASKVSALFRQMTLDHIFDNESEFCIITSKICIKTAFKSVYTRLVGREVNGIEPTHKRKRSDSEIKPQKASVVRNLGPSWQSKEI
jgi:hypothetical protein